MTKILFLCTLLVSVGVWSCRSSIESTSSETRDTTVVFQPPPIDDTVNTRDSTIIGTSPDCDTVAILTRYGSFDTEKDDSSYFWRAQYDAVKGKLRLVERRPAEIKTIPIENIYKQTKIVKDSLIDRIGQWGVGAVFMLGLCIVAVVLLKLKQIL